MFVACQFSAWTGQDHFCWEPAWTLGNAIANEPHSPSPALAVIAIDQSIYWFRDVVFITVCEGAAQHCIKEERMMGVTVPSSAEMEISEELPSFLGPGLPSFTVRSSGFTGLAPFYTFPKCWYHFHFQPHYAA